MSTTTSDKGSTASRHYRPLSELNVIDSFMFRTLLSRDDTKHEVCDLILSEILGREFKSADVHAEEVFPGEDTNLHGIRLDAYITEEGRGDVFYDLEPDNNSDDKDWLPQRNRFYSSMIDHRGFASGKTYDELFRQVIVMITSYDPFGPGDLYYEASTCLRTHDDIPYDDGIRRIYLYADGKNNLEILRNKGLDIPADGQGLQDMVRYICHSDCDHAVTDATIRLDNIVSRIRKDRDVDMNYEILTANAKEEFKREYIKNIREEERLEGRQEMLEHYEPLLAQEENDKQRLREQLLAAGITPVV